MHENSSNNLHQALAVLAPPRRFELLLLLLTGVDRSVSQLADAVGLSQSCTTRHLQALTRAGLVKGGRDGKRVVFRIAPRDAAAEAVLASLAARAPQPRAHDRRARVRRLAPSPPKRPVRSRAADPRGIPKSLLGAVIHVDSAADFEPLQATDPAPASVVTSARDSRAVPESGNRSGTPAQPAWRRSDLEDFLL
jgi:DNA-binding transcriptional ArsR family regulator